MKIALCKSHFAGPVSGADETLVTYAIKLRQAGHNAHVALLYKHSNNDRYFKRLERAGVPVDNVIERSIAFMILRGLRNSLSSILLFIFLVPNSTDRLRAIWQVLVDLISRLHYRKCKKHFAAANYDVLHIFTPDTGAAMMIRAGNELGIPVLYHEMGTPDYLPALEPYYKRLEKVLPLCNEVAALSPTLTRQWLSRFPFLPSMSTLPLISDDCERIPPTINVVGNNETVFGFAARVETGKGPFILVDALTKFEQNGQRAFLRIAGTGPELPEIRKRVRELDLIEHCEFVGAYSGTLGCSAFMRSLDVFVLPSFAEGTSNSVIEAMAHGLPVIATNVGGLPDLITPDVGILVPPRDSILLAKAMEKLAHDRELRTRMGKAARERYQKLFATDAVLPLLAKTYARLTGTATLADHSANGNHPWGDCENVRRQTRDALIPGTELCSAAIANQSPFDLIPEAKLARENAAG
ncbi:MAG TPA: glycosyltransferase [Pyrinomonadaceae bacterium]|nr:glycosyltransferase [Pyrinomonadaceae bacterium]